MRLDSAESRAGGRDALSPMQIAHHPLFTAREKIEMLEEMKIGLSGPDLDVDGLGFSPEEIDEAIQEIKVEVQNGVGSETVLRGDA
jgi:hypothetical protein